MTISNNDLIACLIVRPETQDKRKNDILMNYIIKDIANQLGYSVSAVHKALAFLRKVIDKEQITLKCLIRYLKANYYFDSTTGNYIKMQLKDETNGGNVCHPTP